MGIIRVDDEDEKLLKKVDPVPRKALKLILRPTDAVLQNVTSKDALADVAKRILDEIESRVRTVVREELEKVSG